MSKIKKLIYPILVFPLIMSTVVQESTAIPSKCEDVVFVFARGTGQELEGKDFKAFKNSITDKLRETNLKYSIYELGQKSQAGARYPAVKLDISTAISTYISEGKASKFNDSVELGKKELITLVRNKSAMCQNTKFAIAGYSQGAIVLHRAINSIDPNKIIYMATIGDPHIYLPEGYGIIPPACQGKNLSNYRVYAPDCHTHEGILGAVTPFEPKQLKNKLGTWCESKDIICSSSFNITDPIGNHVIYDQTGKYNSVADEMLKRIKKVFPDKGIRSNSPRNTAFIIDTSGSMDTIIAKYKEHARNLALKTIEDGGKIALYEYRDLNDPYKAKQLCDFSCNYKTFTEKLDSLQTDGGGDDPESALSALKHAMNTLKWEQGATKSIVLLTDAGYHQIDFDGTTLEEVVKISKQIDPVNIYTITPENIGVNYAELTTKTGGKIINLDDNDLDLLTQELLERPNIKFELDDYYSDGKSKVNLNLITDQKITKFEWDLNADGIFEKETTIPSLSISPTKTLEVVTKVTNKKGQTNTAFTTIHIEKPQQKPKIVIKSAFKKQGYTELHLSKQDGATQILVIVDDAFYGITNKDTVKVTANIDKLKLIPVNKNGYKGEILEYLNNHKYPTIPNSGGAPLLESNN